MAADVIPFIETKPIVSNSPAPKIAEGMVIDISCHNRAPDLIDELVVYLETGLEGTLRPLNLRWDDRKQFLGKTITFDANNLFDLTASRWAERDITAESRISPPPLPRRFGRWSPA